MRLVHLGPLPRLRSIKQNQAYTQLYKSDKKNASAYFYLCAYTFSFSHESTEFYASGPWGPIGLFEVSNWGRMLKHSSFVLF